MARRKRSHKRTHKDSLPFSQTRKRHRKKSQKKRGKKSMRRKSMRRVSKAPLETGGNWLQVALRRMIKQPHGTRKSSPKYELNTIM